MKFSLKNEVGGLSQGFSLDLVFDTTLLQEATLGKSVKSSIKEAKSYLEKGVNGKVILVSLHDDWSYHLNLGWRVVKRKDLLALVENVLDWSIEGVENTSLSKLRHVIFLE